MLAAGATISFYNTSTLVSLVMAAVAAIRQLAR
jgi:hypothetical protein